RRAHHRSLLHRRVPHRRNSSSHLRPPREDTTMRMTIPRFPSARSDQFTGKQPRSNGILLRSVIGLGVLVAVGLLAPFLGFADPLAPNLSAQLSPPSFEHLLGTDSLGRDILSRSVHAITVDLSLALIGV